MAARPTGRWAFVIACVIAGALAVPLDAFATPVSAAAFGLAGFMGLRVWRWSRLPQLIHDAGERGFSGPVRLAVWWALGFAIGLLVLGVIRLGIEPLVPSIGVRIARAGTLPVWRRVLIIYVAAVGEELVFRVLLLSVLSGLMARLLRQPGQRPSSQVVWCANVIAALAFAAVHLPAWRTASIGPGLLMSVLALNAFGGIVCGYMFTTRGIGAAIWTHSGADCVIQLLGPFTG